MLIISRFHDYYDRAVAHGVDKKTVFKRETKELPSGSLFGSGSGWGTLLTWENFWVGFCGRWYFGRKEVTPYKNPYEPGETKFWYGVEAADRAYPAVSSSYWYQSSLRQSILRDHCQKAALDHFITNDSPILLVYKKKLIVNPRLSDYQFQKVISPYEAFQSIEMFITNELAKQIDPAPLSDKDRIKAHGFDKWSFRRDTPPKRKQK